MGTKKQPWPGYGNITSMEIGYKHSTCCTVHTEVYVRLLLALLSLGLVKLVSYTQRILKLYTGGANA